MLLYHKKKAKDLTYETNSRTIWNNQNMLKWRTTEDKSKLSKGKTKFH